MLLPFRPPPAFPRGFFAKLFTKEKKEDPAAILGPREPLIYPLSRWAMLREGLSFVC